MSLLDTLAGLLFPPVESRAPPSRKKLLEPPPGHIHTDGGQAYSYRGLVRSIRLDGRTVELYVWDTYCAECGTLFQVASSGVKPKRLTRRCDLHKRPGKPVGKRG